MARNGSGVYSLPAGYLAETGTTIQATQHNSPLQDLETDANEARPIVAGGTGATTASQALTNLGLSDFGKTLVDDASAATARATLGVHWELLSAATASSSTTIDFTGLDTSTYAAFRVIIANARPVVDSSPMWLRLRTQSGATWRSSAGEYAYQHLGVSSSTATTLPLSLSSADLGNVTGEDGWSGEILLCGMGRSDQRTGVTFSGGYWSDAGAYVAVAGAGALVVREVNDGIRVAIDGSTLDGRFTLLGMRAS